MKTAVIVGSGISGMTCAVTCASLGIHAILVSPFPSERSQSVMAAGGINAVLSDNEEGDSIASHIEDTLAGGSFIGGKKAVSGLCENAEGIILFLERIGTVFSRDPKGNIAVRAFGGQSHKRTCFCGSSTGKQIVSALVMETRRYESKGMIIRKLRADFHSALIRDGACYGILVCDQISGMPEPIFADAVIIAAGGQNALFGKTTGSSLCDGYAAGKLFLQGAELKNLEFIQYHPTTLETGQKRMLISEAVRGEGGRLFYVENGKRVYFMEEKYGPRGNLMTRDVTAREIDAQKRDVYLDISFLGEKEIDRRLPEVRDLCAKYRGIDICREPIPVAPSVHFFMGGLAVRPDHETNIRNLYAVGECASMYHGANRLGGNSLLAAIYSGRIAAKAVSEKRQNLPLPKPEVFSAYIEKETARLEKKKNTESRFPVMYIRNMLAETMRNDLGIVRKEDSLEHGIQDIRYYLSVADQIRYDNSVPPFYNYSLNAILTIAEATLLCAKERKESRGAHFRSDYPETKDDFAYASVISRDPETGACRIRLDKEHVYES